MMTFGKSTRYGALALILGTAIPSMVQAQDEPTLTFEGLLLDDEGNPLSGSTPLVITLYSSQDGGQPLWEESQVVELERGAYQLTLAPPPDIVEQHSLFLEVRSPADEEQFCPRHSIKIGRTLRQGPIVQSLSSSHWSVAKTSPSAIERSTTPDLAPGQPGSPVSSQTVVAQPPSTTPPTATSAPITNLPPAGMIATPDEQPFSGERGGGDGWNGTGVQDPEPLRTVTDAEMLQRAILPGAPQDRLNALVSIGRRHLPGVMKIYTQNLKDPEYIVRMLSVSGAIEHGGPEALTVLWKYLQEDRHVFIRRNAMWGIAKYGQAEAMKAIRYGLDSRIPGLMGGAILALAQLPASSEQDAIIQAALNHPQQEVWQEAIYALEYLGKPHHLALLQSRYPGAPPKMQQMIRAHLRKRNIPLPD